MGSKRTDLIKDRIVQNARKFLGTPFRHSGRSTLGIDCAGLLYLSYYRAGIDLPKGDGREYTVGWWKHTDAEERLFNGMVAAGFVPLSDNKLIDKADVLLFRLYGDKYPAHHSAIMIDKNYFIHAKCGWRERKSRVDFDPLESSYTQKNRLAWVMRHKELF